MAGLNVSQSTTAPTGGYNLISGVTIPSLIVMAILVLAALLLLNDWKRRRRKVKDQQEGRLRQFRERWFGVARSPPDGTRSGDAELAVLYVSASDSEASEQSQETRILLDNSEVEEEEEEEEEAEDEDADRLDQVRWVGDQNTSARSTELCGLLGSAARAATDSSASGERKVLDLSKGITAQANGTREQTTEGGGSDSPVVNCPVPSGHRVLANSCPSLLNCSTVPATIEGSRRTQREDITDLLDDAMVAGGETGAEAEVGLMGPPISVKMQSVPCPRMTWTRQKQPIDVRRATAQKKKCKPPLTITPMQEQTPPGATRSPPPWREVLYPDLNVMVRDYDVDPDAQSGAGLEESTRGDPVSALRERLGTGTAPDNGPNSLIQMEVGSDSDRSRHSSCSSYEGSGSDTGAL